MKCRLSQFSLPLSPPLFLMRQKHFKRDGLLLHLEDSGFVGLGEINPLPGLHSENFESAAVQASSLIDRLSESFLPLNINSFRHFIFDVANDLNLFPSVLFGLESALLNLLAQRLNIVPALLLNPDAADVLTINALLAGDSTQMPETLQALLARGCRTVKVKVGREEIASEIALIKELNDQLPEGAVLRLDANQAWEFEEAVQFMQGVGECAIEYLEEPLKNPERLAELAEFSMVKVALDESLVAATPENTTIANNVAALILKPAVLGGALKTELWSKKARQQGVDVVISGSFCSSVGLISEAMIASAFSRSAAGLGTWRWLADDLLTERFAPKNYVVSVEELFSQFASLDETKLDFQD
ncbi:MAG: o-succinylbenzoate synthase [Calditrichia bacterium]